MKTIGLVCLFWVVVWVVKWPEPLWETLMFRFGSSLKDRLMSVGVWFYFVASATGVVLVITGA